MIARDPDRAGADEGAYNCNRRRQAEPSIQHVARECPDRHVRRDREVHETQHRIDHGQAYSGDCQHGTRHQAVEDELEEFFKHERPRARLQLLRPLPLWERAAPTLKAESWVRGNTVTPHPTEVVETPAMPSPTRGEGPSTLIALVARATAVPHIFTSTSFPSFTCAVRNATSMMLPLSANLHGPDAPEYLISLPSAISFNPSGALSTMVPFSLLPEILRMLSRMPVPLGSLPFAIARIARLAWS